MKMKEEREEIIKQEYTMAEYLLGQGLFISEDEPAKVAFLLRAMEREFPYHYINFSAEVTENGKESYTFYLESR